MISIKLNNVSPENKTKFLKAFTEEASNNLKAVYGENSIKKNINISTKINKESIIYKYELKSAIIYDMLTNKNELKKELENKPIIL